MRDYKKLVGGNAFDSQTGFAIGPGKRIVSPDASWVGRSRIEALAPGEDEGFWPLSPDVAIEVRSAIDSFKDTVAKAALYVERDSVYAVAIDPSTREVVEVGIAPAELQLDFGAIIDA